MTEDKPTLLVDVSGQGLVEMVLVERLGWNPDAGVELARVILPDGTEAMAARDAYAGAAWRVFMT